MNDGVSVGAADPYLIDELNDDPIERDLWRQTAARRGITEASYVVSAYRHLTRKDAERRMAQVRAGTGGEP